MVRRIESHGFHGGGHAVGMAPQRIALPPAGPAPCGEGFKMSGTRCITIFATPKLAEYEPGKRICRPGETREVPDPNSPNGFKIQTCGFVGRQAAASQHE
jgi:hypothetical protein